MAQKHDQNMLSAALAAMEAGPTACFLLDPVGPTIIAANAAAERLYGYGAGCMAGLPLSAVSETETELLRARTLEVLAVGTSPAIATHRKADGTRIQMAVQAFRSLPQGEPLAVMILTPLSEASTQPVACSDLVEPSADLLFRAITEHSSDLICLHRPDGTYLYVSPSSRRLLGYAPEELIGKNPYDYFHPDDARAIRDESHAKAMSGEIDPRVEYRFRAKSGAWIWLQTLTMPIADAEGKPYLLETTSRDVTDLKAKEAEIRALAFHDQLTGLPNRRLLQDRIDQAIAMASRTGGMVGVCFLDLDGFKSINDTYGHAFGDEVLVKSAVRLRACLRQADTAARMGGDEFVAVMGGLTREEDADLATKRIVESISEPLEISGISSQIGISIGLAFFPGDGCDGETLMRRADIALYASKSAGKSRATRYGELPQAERNRFECPDPNP